MEKASAAAHASPSQSQKYDFDILQSVLRTAVMKMLQRYPVFPLPRFKVTTAPPSSRASCPHRFVCAQLSLRAVTGNTAQPNCWRSGIPLTVSQLQPGTTFPVRLKDVCLRGCMCRCTICW